MSLPANTLGLGVDDYLTGEPESEIKHEYIDGQVHAMAGASERHNRIALNIAFHLRVASRGGACRAFISDMLLHVPCHNAFYWEPRKTQGRAFSRFRCESGVPEGARRR